MSAITEMWAVADPENKIIAVKWTEAVARYDACRRHRKTIKEWPQMEKSGYRCIRVTVKEEPT